MVEYLRKAKGRAYSPSSVQRSATKRMRGQLYYLNDWYYFCEAKLQPER